MVAADRPRPGSVRRHFAIAVRNLVASVYVLGRWWEFLLTPVLMIGLNQKARPPAAPFPFCATLFGGKMGIKPNFMKSPNQRGEWTEARFALALNFLSSSLHLLEKPWSDGRLVVTRGPSTSQVESLDAIRPASLRMTSF